jgi:phosphoribosylaminoimidazole-succinocarboxamide synthase
MRVVTETSIVEYPLVSRGKVRDIYEIDAETLLIVTTDRMSAFDVIMSAPVPYKGVVLNQITIFWMQRFAGLVKNHLLEHDIERFPEPLHGYKSVLEGRSVLVRKATPLMVECIVRGNIYGSGWKD